MASINTTETKHSFTPLNIFENIEISQLPNNKIERITQKVVNLLQHLISKEIDHRECVDKFTVTAIPSISLKDYIKRIVKNGNIVESVIHLNNTKTTLKHSFINCSTLAHAIILMKNYSKSGKRILLKIKNNKPLYRYEQNYITKYNVHKLFAIAILLSVKFIQDTLPHSLYFKRLVGLGDEKLHLLEQELLQSLEYTLFLDEKETTLIYNYLRKSLE